MTHCSPPTPPPRSREMAGNATLTTVASRAAMPEPRTVAARMRRPMGLPYATSDTLLACALQHHDGNLPRRLALIFGEARHQCRLGGEQPLAFFAARHPRRCLELLSANLDSDKRISHQVVVP